MKWLGQIYTQPGFNPWQSDPEASAANLLHSNEEPMEIVLGGVDSARRRTGEAASPSDVQGNCAPGVLWVPLRRWGEERNCVNICFCLSVFLPAPPPIRRAVLKNEECCLGFCKEDPRTCINERRGSHSWQKNKGLSRSPGLLASPGACWLSSRRLLPVGLPQPGWLPAASWKSTTPQSLDSPYMGQLMSSAGTADTSPYCSELALVTRQFAIALPLPSEKCLFSSL